MSSLRPVITLTTDFGLQDPYVGLMKGVILSINANAEVVDVTHGVAPQNVLQGSFLLHRSHRYFPADTIHVAVVDPGVGTNRRPVLLETPDGRFIAPDNGLLTHVLLGGLDLQSTVGGRMELPDGWKAWHLTNPDYWLQPLSHTFHGRDLFAPVAAHLSKDVQPPELGEEIKTLQCLPMSTPHWWRNELRGRVVHVDRYGNLVTDIPSSEMKDDNEILVQIGGETIHSLSSSYAEANGLLAIIGSFDTLEIALKNGNAATRLALAPAAPVTVRRRS